MDSYLPITPEVSEGIFRLLGLLQDRAAGISRENLAYSHGLRRLLPADESALETAKLQLTGYALRMLAVQQEILETLEVQGVRALSLKGFTLSYLLYGELGFREFGDLDLLISPHDAERTYQCLESLGYSRVRPSGFSESQECAHIRYGKAQSWLNAKTQAQIDLHWRLLSNWVGERLLPFEELWQRSRLMEVESLPRWRTLGNEDTLVFLVLHGAQDGWASLKQILDLGQAVTSLEVDWELASVLANFRRPMFERAVELCCRLLGIPCPDMRQRYFSTDQEAIESWLKTATATRAPHAELLSPSLMDGPSLEIAWRALSSLLTPAIDDIASVNLPRPVIGLYPVIRAFRLAQKAVQRRPRKTFQS